MDKNSHSLSKIELYVFKEHFKKLGVKNANANDLEPVYDITEGDHSVNENINEEFTIDELRLIIRKIKNGKACGIDHIRNDFLKACPHELIVIMLKFFNDILNSGIVPELRCIGLIMPLYKNKGGQFDPDNYRGITLLSCMGTVFNALIICRLTK